MNDRDTGELLRTAEDHNATYKIVCDSVLARNRFTDLLIEAYENAGWSEGISFLGEADTKELDDLIAEYKRVNGITESDEK